MHAKGVGGKTSAPIDHSDPPKDVPEKPSDPQGIPPQGSPGTSRDTPRIPKGPSRSAQCLKCNQNERVFNVLQVPIAPTEAIQGGSLGFLGVPGGSLGSPRDAQRPTRDPQELPRDSLGAPMTSRGLPPK